jgi:PAS domain S-box-containing protein
MKSKTISKPTRLSTLINNHIQAAIVILTMSLLIVIMLISWWAYQIDLNNIKTMVMNHKKEIIVSMIDHIIEQIKIAQQKLSSQDSYSQCKESIKQRLKSISFLNGTGYIFVISYDGIVQVNAKQPYLVGKNIFHQGDKAQAKFAKRVIETANKSAGGFLTVLWKKPGGNQITNKLIYVRGVKDWQWAVGTGIYLDDLKYTIAKTKKNLQYYLIAELFVILTTGLLVMIGMLFVSRRVARNVSNEIKQLTTDIHNHEELPHFFETRYRIYEFREIAKITHQALTRVFQLQHNLQGIFDNVDDFFIILDINGNIIGMNQTVFTRLSYSQQDLLNQPITLLFPPDDRKKIQQFIRQIRAGIIPEMFDTPLLKKDGTILETETRIVNSQWDGRQSILCVSKDITDIKRSKARLENIIKGTNVGTWEWNLQTNEIVYNDRLANILGYTLAELSPITIYTFIDRCHPEDFDRLDKGLKAHFNGETPFYDDECRMKHKNGSIIWIHVRGQLISRTIEGAPLFMTGIHMDITQRKRAEERLKVNLNETERINKLMEGREQRIIELKKEVNALRIDNDQAPKYRSVL